QPLHAAAFLVDGDEQGSGSRRLQRPRQLGDLVGVDHVALEEDHARDPPADQVELLRGGCRSLNAGDDAACGELLVVHGGCLARTVDPRTRAKEGSVLADCSLVAPRGDRGSLFRCPAGDRLVEIVGRASPAEARFPLSRLKHRIVVSGLLVCALCASAGAGAASSDRQALRSAFDALLSQPPFAGARASVEVVSLDDGSVIYSRGADDQLNPASNTKLVTAAAALLRLGPEFRFTTDVLADRSPDQRGHVQTLYVKGRGDPTWNTERLYGLAADLWHRGIRH